MAEKRARAMKPQAKPLDVEELHAENFWGLTMPLHVLVGNSNARKATRNLHCHISSGEFPDGSFVRLGSGLVVSSPELCFLQMASELPLVDLIALGYELCGGYRLVEDREEGKGYRAGSPMDSAGIPPGIEAGKQEMGFRKDLPVTSVGSLVSYASKATGLKGYKNTLKALRFIADGSNSPMETILAILFVLPYRLGGYGFPKPLLNHRIEVPISARKAAGKSKYYCDMYWPIGKVAVEYDSDAYHTGPDRIAQDAIRRNILSGMGITVVTVSRRQVMETPKMYGVAVLLSKLLGKRLQYPAKEFTYRHAKLREQLLPKRSASGYSYTD